MRLETPCEVMHQWFRWKYLEIQDAISEACEPFEGERLHETNVDGLCDAVVGSLRRQLPTPHDWFEASAKDRGDGRYDISIHVRPGLPLHERLPAAVILQRTQEFIDS
jgi:hypothetical protein